MTGGAGRRTSIVTLRSRKLRNLSQTPRQCTPTRTVRALWTPHIPRFARSVDGLDVLRHAAESSRTRRAGTSPVEPLSRAVRDEPGSKLVRRVPANIPCFAQSVDDTQRRSLLMDERARRSSRRSAFRQAPLFPVQRGRHAAASSFRRHRATAARAEEPLSLAPRWSSTPSACRTLRRP
jgi:hypothetical protein